MKDVQALLASAAARLNGDSARMEAEILLAQALDRSRTWLFTRPEFEPSDAQVLRFEALLQARCGGEPIAYLLGRRGFWSFDLAVSPAVLIPREDTELLVELALARIPADVACAVADLGTGSGAIALALAAERPQARVVATDASADALAVARGNAEALGLHRVEFRHGDWCAALGGERFDLIGSNPPYIASADPHLDAGDLRFEPSGALVSGTDGLDAIRRIVATAPPHLAAAGWLLLEHGWQQGAAVRALLLEHGFSDVETVRDLGDRDRVSLGRVRS